MSHYEHVLDDLRKNNDKLAAQYITELYNILRDEEQHSPQDCRAKIEDDCSDIWSQDTIRKYLPPETKSAIKRKAGKISAKVKKKKKERKEPKLLTAIATTTDTGECSEVLNNDRDTDDNSVGINPTENGSVVQKEQVSRTFQEIMDSQYSTKIFSDDHFFSLVADRQKDEILDLLEDLSIDECISKCINKSLILPSGLAEQIFLLMHNSRTSGAIPNFELEHNSVSIISVRLCSFNRDLSETELSPEGTRKC